MNRQSQRTKCRGSTNMLLSVSRRHGLIFHPHQPNGRHEIGWLQGFQKPATPGTTPAAVRAWPEPANRRIEGAGEFSSHHPNFDLAAQLVNRIPNYLELQWCKCTKKKLISGLRLYFTVLWHIQIIEVVVNEHS